MDGLISAFKDFMPYIVIGLLVIIIILIILIAVIFSSLNSLEKRYRKMMRGANNKNLEELINGYLDKVDRAVEISDNTKKILIEQDNRIKGCIQKVSITRFKAFEDVGSDLSFSVAILDGNNDGVIITGIYGRHDSTTYAKPIDKGISRYDLSEEEQTVLKDAMSK